MQGIFQAEFNRINIQPFGQFNHSLLDRCSGFSLAKASKCDAVTIIGVGVTSMPIYEPDPIFRVNKPFLFVIREKSTGVILFMGKMGNVDKF